MRWHTLQAVILLVLFASVHSQNISAIFIPPQINLTYQTTEVNCTNNFSTTTDQISSLTSILYDENNSNWNSADDNNNHYTNSTCELVNTSGSTCTATCSFEMEYYSNPGNNWICRMDYQFVNTTTDVETINTTINELVNSHTETLSFSSVALNSTSDTITMIVENRGNVNININVSSVYETAMVCENGKIPLSNMRYGTSPTENFEDMTSIGQQSTQISGLSIARRTDDSTPSFGNIYWKIRIGETGLAGNCAGTLEILAMR